MRIDYVTKVGLAFNLTLVIITKGLLEIKKWGLGLSRNKSEIGRHLQIRSPRQELLETPLQSIGKLSRTCAVLEPICVLRTEE